MYRFEKEWDERIDDDLVMVPTFGEFVGIAMDAADRAGVVMSWHALTEHERGVSYEAYRNGSDPQDWWKVLVENRMK